MQHINLAPPQQVNACTLISIAVIDAIIRADNGMSAISTAILKAQESSQALYKTLVEDNPTMGEGVLEADAYNRYFAQVLDSPIAVTLSAPADDVDVLINELIENQKGFELADDEAEFVQFNIDLITALLIRFQPGKDVEHWFTVTKQELQEKILGQPVPEVSLAEQILQNLRLLNQPSGMTLNGGGHTISVSNKANIYYCFDSASGKLSTTDSIEEMARYLTEYFSKSNPCHRVETYRFSQKKEVVLSQSPIPLVVPDVKKEVHHEIVAPVYRAPPVARATNHPVLAISAPTSYRELFQRGNTPLERARVLLDDYTKGNSTACRFFHGHWNRHYVKQVASLVDRVNQKQISDIATLIQELHQINIANPHGSLARRIRFIEEQNPCVEINPDQCHGM